MIDKLQVAQLVDRAIEGTDAFVVEISVSPQNDIVVELDSPTGVDLDFCAEVNRLINEALDRDSEDYSLEVGSASLSAPFKVRQQYEKHLGDTVDVLTVDGRKLRGILDDVTDDTFTILVSRKTKEPGMKRPVIVEEPQTLRMSDCRQVSYHIMFK